MKSIVSSNDVRKRKERKNSIKIEYLDGVQRHLFRNISICTRSMHSTRLVIGVNERGEGEGEEEEEEKSFFSLQSNSNSRNRLRVDDFIRVYLIIGLNSYSST